MDSTDLIGLDFETYSAADLRKVGMYNYMRHETFRPLIAALVRPDGFTEFFNFVDAPKAATEGLIRAIGGSTIVAHNAGFEQQVLRTMGLKYPSSRFIDSAVLSRACGYGSALEAAAPQVLGIDKVATGKELIMLFSVPGKMQEANGSDEFDPEIIFDHLDEWLEFGYYCRVDAELSLQLALRLLPLIPHKELDYAAITLDMNNKGWPVDLDLVRRMQVQYEENVRDIEAGFRQRTGDSELNLNSHPQLVEWCEKRGVRARSFDEKAVRKLIARLEKRVVALPDSPKTPGYQEVVDLLRTKQELGGSSLKKLPVIEGQTGDDGRLHDAYLHAGAGATCRTTGRGVQMQNLKRLHGQGDDTISVLGWSNDQLASNLRQVFTAWYPNGQLIVGDFASVESRGLAWQAGEQWKLDAYRNGDDLYKVQAGRIFGKHPADVTGPERQTGKVGELACGYGAGPEAVRAFAEGMGVELNEIEAANLVRDWRDANPRIVGYWQELDAALHRAVTTNTSQYVVREHVVVVRPRPAPVSLQDQVGDDKLLSLEYEVQVEGEVQFVRTVHGVHEDGRNLRYWKPSDRKTGDLWTDRYTDPKTGLVRRYSLYGGKLAGLLTQSLCREVFFESLSVVHGMVRTEPNLRLIGQFHDEIVLEWWPDRYGIELSGAVDMLRAAMSVTSLPGFPLSAEVKHDHRYIK